jgi:hypothetical protein
MDSGERLLQQLDESSGLGHLYHFIHLLLKCATTPCYTSAKKALYNFNLNTIAFAKHLLQHHHIDVIHPLTFFHKNSEDGVLTEVKHKYLDRK